LLVEPRSQVHTQSHSGSQFVAKRQVPDPLCNLRKVSAEKASSQERPSLQPNTWCCTRECSRTRPEDWLRGGEGGGF
jgi:hypothetical protein